VGSGDRSGTVTGTQRDVLSDRNQRAFLRIMPPIEPEQAYGFPVLDLDSICDTLGQWQINVKPSQLRNPSSDFVFNIYAQILQRLMGMSEGTLSQVVDEGVDSLNTPHSVCTYNPVFSAKVCVDLV
jgi:hypothetical protein